MDSHQYKSPRFANGLPSVLGMGLTAALALLGCTGTPQAERELMDQRLVEQAVATKSDASWGDLGAVSGDGSLGSNPADSAEIATTAPPDGPTAASPVPEGFRERTLFQIAQVLGREPRTKQDAINAAYLAAGWQPGKAATREIDEDAYGRARTWGFSITTFRRRGAKTAFRSSDLASHPLLPAQARQERGPRSKPMPKEDTDQPSRQPTAPVAQGKRNEPNAEAGAQRLKAIHLAVKRLETEIASLTEEISRLERAKSSWKRSRPDWRTEKPSLEAAIQRLEQSLLSSEVLLREAQRKLSGLEMPASSAR